MTNTQHLAIVTCGCPATQDAVRHGELTGDPGRCIGCGTPVDAPKEKLAGLTFTNVVTEYGITVRNPFKVF